MIKMNKLITVLLLFASVAFSNVITHTSYNQTGGAEGHPDSVITVVDEDNGSGLISDSDGETGQMTSSITNPITGMTVETYQAWSKGGGIGGVPLWRRLYNWTIAYDEERKLVMIMKSKTVWTDINGDGKMDDNEIITNDFADNGEGIATYNSNSVSVGAPGTVDV